LSTSSERYITLFAAVLDTKNHLLSYINAGHNYPLCVNEKSGRLAMLTEGGIPLGMMPDATFRMETVPLQPSDLLVFYTDGVTEAKNKSFADYGDDRLRECIERNISQNASQLKSSILQDVHQFTGAEPQSDDLTLVVMKRTHSTFN
jgi:sigma-B regulation protein RsbU (phosphoserine phosphatase)